MVQCVYLVLYKFMKINIKEKTHDTASCLIPLELLPLQLAVRSIQILQFTCFNKKYILLAFQQRNMTPSGSPILRGSNSSSLTSPLPVSSSTCLPGADSGGSGGNCESSSTASPVVSPHNNHNISGICFILF